MKTRVFTILPVLISLLLFIIPFFWLRPGEMDLGGDSSRLYFYDPLSYFKNYSFFGVSPSGLGAENIGYFTIPFVLLLFVLKFILQSPTILISAFHGMSLSAGFLACYFIVKELIGNKDFKKEIIELAALLAGLFYVLSLPPIQGWDKVLIIHNQFFLNPLIFFLLLKYFKTTNIGYLISILLTTFIFSPNFSFAASPAVFAFYPLTVGFLILYRVIIFKKPIIWKHLIISFVAFVLLQSFHIVPQVISTFSPDSVIYKTVFSNEGKFDRGLSYFVSIASSIKVSINFMGLPQMTELGVESLAYIIFPAIILFGYLLNKRKAMLLTGIFFLIALFFSSANITNVGFDFYKTLFNIPGFSMFRNFYGQWGYVFLFFYTILLGQSLAIVLSQLKRKYSYFLAIFITLFLVIPAWPFINGTLVNKVLWQSKDVKIAMKIDPKYEEMLAFIRGLPDGKILTLPLTDPGYQIIAGKDGGAYQGPSTISYLTGKQDFAGFDELGRFNGLILDLVREKQFDSLKKVLGLLNIKYIFYNADPKIYDKAFPAFPYEHVKQFLPQDQKSYQKFIKQLSLKQLKAIDNKYFIYELDDSNYHPILFTTNNINYFGKPITDWIIPLSFEKEKYKTSAFFESQYVPAFSENSFIPLESKSIFLKIIKNPDPPRKFHHIFYTRPPGLFWYPLVVFKEKLELRRYGDYAIDYLVDRRLFLAAKRVFDLEGWGNQIPVLGTAENIGDLRQVFKEPKIFKGDPKFWDLDAWHNVNSWEAILARYTKYFEDNISTVKNADESVQWKTEQKFIINEYLLQHRVRLSKLIQNIKKSEEEKVYLDKLIAQVFLHLQNTLDFSLDMPSSIEYTLGTGKELPQGIYEVYADKKALAQTNINDISIKIGDKNLQVKENRPDSRWIKFEDLTIENKKKKTTPFLVIKNTKNLMNEAQHIALENINISTDSATLAINAPFLKRQGGLIWKIENWQEQNYYLLSFEYLTNGNLSVLKMFEGNTKENKMVNPNLILENQLNSSQWEKYQAVVRTNQYVNTGFLQFADDTTNMSLSRIELRNISLVAIPHPQIFLKKTSNAISRTHGLPKITFTKINPTKYKITVKDANDPYFLVLNQEFNSRWKLFLEDKKKYKYNLGIPFDSNILETVGVTPISEKNHLRVNGYANAWYIAPSDVKNAKEYTLIAEMTTQQYFYFGLAISTMTLVGVVIFGIYKRYYDR